MPDSPQARGLLIRLSPFLFVLLWSSSFVAARVGLRHITPLLFVAVRMAGCAAVLVTLMLLLRRSWRPLGGWRWLHCAIAGSLMNAVGLMAPHVGLLTTPSAQIALVQSLTPLLAAVLGVFLLHEPLQPRQWTGLLLGVAGVALVVGQAALTSPARFQGLLLAFLGVIGIVSGTLYFGRFCRNVPLLEGATAQFVSAFVTASAGAWLLETPHADWTAGAIEATAWNTVMVSLGGMGLYFLMLSRGTAARTSANFYLVPGTTALLAWAFTNESLSNLALAGLVVASAGCWLVNAGARRTA
ncbi:MAG TPA: DMT family transporter [Rhodopila sp.]|nr:DMT family transporter [Rhodopila sp.]